MTEDQAQCIEDFRIHASRLVETAADDLADDTLEDRAMGLVALARHAMGVACPRCGGFGERSYGSTATWRGGIGGQTITADVCDRCWGTGRTDKTGPNLRELRNRLEAKR